MSAPVHTGSHARTRAHTHTPARPHARPPGWLRTRRLSEVTFRPSGATNHGKNTVSRDFTTFTHLHLLSSHFFYSLIFSLLFFSSMTLPASAFPSVHIVGSLTSKLPSVIKKILSGSSCILLHQKPDAAARQRKRQEIASIVKVVNFGFWLLGLIVSGVNFSDPESLKIMLRWSASILGYSDSHARVLLQERSF